MSVADVDTSSQEGGAPLGTGDPAGVHRHPPSRRAGAVLVLAAALLTSLTGCGPAFTAPALAAKVGPVFANLYVRAQVEQGRTGVTAAGLQVTSVCARGGANTPNHGPGADWACMVGFKDGDAPFRQLRYETTLRPDGCFVADGPPGVVGDANFLDADGVRRVNPLYALEGCL